MMLVTTCYFDFLEKRPHQEITGSAPNMYFFEYLKRVKNFKTLVEQKQFEIFSPFFWYQAKGADPLN